VRPGIIDVYENGMPTITERIFVAGGFAEVTPERCTVLADEAVPLSALDRTALEGEARTLESTIGGLKDQSTRTTGDDREATLRELATAERRLGVARAKLEALG
jgi:F-type H+-transporting ATPase subunit epsilon